jgi:hypothetical protein
MVSLVLIAIGGLLIPSFLLVSAQREAVTSELAGGISEEDSPYATVVSSVEKANNISRLLIKQSPYAPASVVISEIQKEQLDQITLTGITYGLEKGEQSIVEVRGIAATRKALADFVARLKRNPEFLDAEVPVSDLASDTDAPFLITVILASRTIE